MVKAIILSILAVSLAGAAAPHAMAHDADDETLSRVRDRGHVICGTARNEVGLSEFRRGIGWTGLFIDLCHALGAAVFGDKQSVQFRPLTSSARFDAVAKHEVDVLARATAWTLTNEASAHVRFVGPFFHDGKGFMVRKVANLSSALELSGARVCVLADSHTANAVHRYFLRRDMRYTKVTAATWSALVARYRDGRCTVLSADLAQLAVQRRAMPQPSQHVLLPETVSHDMFGPVVAESDSDWFKVVRWVMFALMHAEEVGLTSTNVVSAELLEREEVRNFLEATEVAGQQLGLAEKWLPRVIRQVGNYGEIFERCLGKASGIQLPRGRNALALNGGLVTVPSFR